MRCIPTSEFESLPVAPVRRGDGSELKVYVTLHGRRVTCKVWSARCGHVTLYLLDTDLEENDERARNITHQLYGGDRTTRIEQEIVLGVGGVRALEELQLKPTVWHINEGHAAFLVLERMRALTGARPGARRRARVRCRKHRLHHAHAGAGGP